MADKKKRQVINDLSRGRNGFDAPWAIADGESADAVNVDNYRTKFANKRGGMALATQTSMSLTGVVSSAFRHVPTISEANAELWLVDDAATPVVDRLAGGTAWAAPTLKDAPTGNGWDFAFASINAKLALAYKSAQNRMHFWDTSTVRRGGLAAPAAPAISNTGSGTSIAFDAAASLVFAAAATFSHTCGASATILWVHTRCDAGAVTAVTYNGVAMTQATSVTAVGFYQLWYLVSPASGAHTVAITGPGSVGAESASYTGASIVGVPDNSTTNTSSASTIVTTLTPVADRTWAILGVSDRSGTDPTASTNSTLRASPGGGSSTTLFDSNGPITPPAAFSMTAGITAANNGSSVMATFAGGSVPYSAVARYYRTRWTRQSAGITIGRSEPGTSVAFTPSGTGTAARVTQPTVANEGETHWEIEASLDNVTFYRIATVAIATTTYDDSAATTSYNGNPISAITGVYTLQKPYKFVAADQNRLLGFGSWNTADKQSRMEFSAVVGSLDIGDEERVDTTTNYFLDFDENDSGAPTGLLGPVLGSYIAFKQRQVAQLTPTGSTAQPYRQDFISKSIGATNQEAITRGEDANGNPALYWMSYNGAYRWGLRGLEYLGRNMEDYVVAGNAVINLAATKRIAVTVYYPDKRQVWFFWATGSSNDPNVGAIFDVKNGGWTRIPSGDLLAAVRCATLFSNTIGATMSRDLKPYVGQVGAVKRICKCDTGTDDLGTPYRAYVITRAEDPGGNGYDGEAGDPILLAKAAEGVTITDTILCDYGIQSSPGSCSLSPEKTETRVTRRIQGAGISGVSTIQHQIGDAIAVSNSWTLDQITTPWAPRGADSA